MPESTIRLAVQEQFLECFINDQITWHTPIAGILLIAEYTTNEGPHVDDYFIELWSLEDGSVLKSRTTFYAERRDRAFARIAQQLETDLNFGLTGSTEWTSRIMWPPDLVGHEYFEFRDIEPSNWREKISHQFFGPTQEYFLTAEVQSFLKNHKLSSSGNREE
jgi:hypothetical protein